MMKITDYRSLFIQDLPLIDVRAPVEFEQGSLPGSSNFPILNDQERALVGTAYKEKGSAAATELGHRLISGEVKEQRLQGWIQFIRQHPSAVLYCFRGGQRSQITQQWLRENSVDRPLIQGGYKAVRQFLMDETHRISCSSSWIVVSGPTGSGKTDFVQSFLGQRAAIDLEQLAKHRGSAFGAMDEPQPVQIDFENAVAVQLMKFEKTYSLEQRLLVEDESRLIGSRALPPSVFERLRTSPVIWIDDPMHSRVGRILRDYVRAPLQRDTSGEKTFAKFRRSVTAIERRLGGLRAQEILADLQLAENAFQSRGELEPNRVWIEKLLNYYYDPLYLGSLDRRQVKVSFRGSFEDCREFLKSNF